MKRGITAKIEQRRAKIAEELASPGKKTRIQIAEKVGTNLAAVKRDLAVLTERFQDSANEAFTEARRQQLEVFELMEQSLVTGQASPDVVNSWRQIRESISKLLGLDAPSTSVRVTTGVGDLKFKAACAGLHEDQMQAVYDFASGLPRVRKEPVRDASWFPAQKELTE